MLTVSARKFFQFWTAVFLAFAIGVSSLSAASAAGAYETPDAGDMLATAMNAEGQTTISGTMSTFDDVDLYRICITSGPAFGVTLGGLGAGNNDGQLFLFNAGGFGVAGVDDTGLGGLVPAIPAGNAVTSALPAGEYYLGVSNFDRDPVSAGVEIFPSIVGVTGPTAGRGALDGWNGAGNANAMTTYTLTLTGVGTCAVPDTTAPTITITAPAEGASYLLGQSVLADYACADEAGGSGLASCTGDVAVGDPIDTGSIGPKTFTVNAADNAGNPATLTANYSVIYDFGGFLQPVDSQPTVNSVKAGAAVPVKFSLSGDQGLGILAEGSPSSKQVQCTASASLDSVEETVSAGGSSLSYDAAMDTYSYVWKTQKAWAGTCRELTVSFVDGTSYSASFRFTK